MQQLLAQRRQAVAGLPASATSRAARTVAQFPAQATVHAPAEAACWSPAEQALLAAVDDLVDCRTIATATWNVLAQHLDEAQILEAIALVGYYHTISFFCRALDLPPEGYAARFPTEREK